MSRFPSISVFLLLVLAVNPMPGEATRLRFGPGTSIRDVDVRIKKYSEIGSLSPGRLGDINGDGYEDFAVGDWRSQAPGPPAVGVFLGRPHWDRNLTFANADFVLKDESDNGELGYHYPLFPGDINGDGYDDIALDAGGWGGGPVFILYGRPQFPQGSIPINQLADLVVRQSTVGYGTQFVGDFTGDGLDDLALWELGDPRAKFYIIPGQLANYASWEGMKQRALTFTTGIGVEGYCQMDWNRDGREEIGGSASEADVTLILGRINPFPNNFVRFFSCLSNEEDEFSVCRKYVYYTKRDSQITFLSHSNGSVTLVSGDENEVNGGVGNGRVYIVPVTNDFWQGTNDLNVPYFKGETYGAGLGKVATFAGDVDSDGWEDCLFSGNYTQGTGAAYCALNGTGKFDRQGIPAMEAEMSFYGFFQGQLLGNWMANVGDVNGDAIDDWCIGGKEEAYLIFPALNTRPFPIKKIRVFTDSTYQTAPLRPFRIWESVYVEVEAEDRDVGTRNVCEVVLKSRSYVNPRGLRIRCKETGDHTGRFRASVLLSDTGANRYWRRMRVGRDDRLDITSWEDKNVSLSLLVRDVTPTPTPTLTPTATPTRTPLPERIAMAGYWDTRLTGGEPGRLKMAAILTHLDRGERGFDFEVYAVNVSYQGNELGEKLSDYWPPSDAVNDGVWGFYWDVSPNVSGVTLLSLTLQRRRDQWPYAFGPVIAQWPYLEVKP